MSGNQDFVHLHVHTEFSLLDGYSRIAKLVDRVKDLGMSSVAITDHGAMFGVIDFYRASKAAGIKPIIGMEAYLTKRGRTRFDKEAGVDTKPYHMLLLAKNQTGYKNLLKIASASQLDGYYYRPRIDHEFMAQHSEGLIATSGCLAAEIPRMVEHGQEAEALQTIGWYQDVFGAENFFLELQHHNIPELHQLNRWLKANQKFANVPFVATNDVHYVLEDDYDTHDTLLCVQTGSVKAEQNRMRFTSPTFHLRTQQEMWRLFGEVPEALTNTVHIAEMCDVNLDSDGYHLPVFPVPEGYNAQTYLRYLCERGLEWRYGSHANDPDVVQRLDYELDIIHKMGFDTYFLIVWDLCEFARHRDIWWNVRGSGAGSVAAYTLGITNIEPMSNHLIFERFLNPGRVSMPDIDLDYPEDRRAEMIQYCAEKYGEDKVAAIITFGTMGSKAALRDVGRVFDMPLTEVDRIARLIPTGGKPIKFKDALGDDPEKALPDLKEVYHNDPTARRLIDSAWALEGITRHASTHAAGVIVADKPLVEYIPLHRPTKGGGEDAPVKRVTQFTMETCESLGLLKVDFLGLSTLTIMRRACEMIEDNHGIHYDLSNIPYRPDPDDPDKSRMVAETFEMMGRGETIGVFQLESQGMRRMLTDMRPNRFEHIVAGISLYRPGPLEYIPTYNRRLHGDEPVEYKHDKLQKILEETYGIIVYQEQIMQIGAELFGYSLGEADLMRRAVSKKKKKALDEHRKLFQERGPEHGVDADSANAIFDDIEFFARYGFNKCVTGDTEVIDAATGRMIRVGDLVNGTTSIEHTVTMDTATLKLDAGPVTHAMRNGVKPVYRLTTQLGRTITATDNHPFYTFDGWRLLGELQTGDQIAVPRRIPVEGRETWPEADIRGLVESLNVDEAGEALPDTVFELTNRQIELLLGLLWQQWGGQSHCLSIASQRLAYQIQHLLLRLGILCSVASDDQVTTLAFVDHERWGGAIRELPLLGAKHAPYPKRSLASEPQMTVGVIHESPAGDVLAASDVYWDKVVSIEYVGEEMTYDLTVPDTHNFVANDIIVHNSHAADYAVLTCQTAFLKCHYPHEFMAALMSVHRDDSAKVGLFAADCHRMGIEILPPTVNDAQLDFSIEHLADDSSAIRFGLGAIKNVGAGPLEHIIEQRNEGGRFKDLDDYCRRVDARIVNRRAVESLIKVGAMDEFGPRPSLLAAVDRIVSFSVDHHKAQDVGQLSLFGAATGVDFGAEESILGQLHDVDPVPKREMLNWEKELVGLYVTDHPLHDIWDDLAHTITHTAAELIEMGEMAQDQEVRVAGLITGIRRVITKRGDAMAILTVEDITATISAVLFPRTWSRYTEWVDNDIVVIVRGKADASRGDMQVIVDELTQRFDKVEAVEDLALPAPPAFSWIDEEPDEFDDSDDDDDTDEVSGGERYGDPAITHASATAAKVNHNGEHSSDQGADDDDLFAEDEDSPYDDTGEMKAARGTAQDDAPTTITEPIVPASMGAAATTAPPIEPPSAPVASAPPAVQSPPPVDDREMPGWINDDYDAYVPLPEWVDSYQPPQRPAPQPAASVAAPPAPNGSRSRVTPTPGDVRTRENSRSAEPVRERERDQDRDQNRDQDEVRPRRVRRRPTPRPEPVPQPDPRLLTLTLQRTTNAAKDRQRMRRLHGMLTQYPGNDRFRFLLVSPERKALLDFPNHSIGINDEMLTYVARLVGEENIHIEDL